MFRQNFLCFILCPLPLRCTEQSDSVTFTPLINLHVGKIPLDKHSSHLLSTLLAHCRASMALSCWLRREEESFLLTFRCCSSEAQGAAGLCCRVTLLPCVLLGISGHFLQSCFPAGQPSTCPGAWCCTGVWFCVIPPQVQGLALPFACLAKDPAGSLQPAGSWAAAHPCSVSTTPPSFTSPANLLRLHSAPF